MVEKGVPDEVVLDELDGLFALLAAQRRGEMLFAEEMAKPDDEIDFVRAAMYIAMHRRADLSRVEDAVEEIDELARELETRLPPPEDRFPLRTLKAVSRYMFDELGFQGNEEEFYDPRNSCLDEVLARRKGIPITLSLVYAELARRVGLPMVGVNLPAHFMIRPVVEDMEVLVDCFRGGEIMFLEDVEEMLRAYMQLTEGEKLQIDRSFFQDETVKPRVFHADAHQPQADLFQPGRIRRRAADRGVPGSLRAGRSRRALQQTRRRHLLVPHAEVRGGGGGVDRVPRGFARA